MSTPLDTDVGHTRLSAGRRSTTAATARFIVPGRRAHGQKLGTFYVLAAVEDDPDEVIAQTIIEAAGQTYRDTRGSLTARLRRAVEAGSAALLVDNLDLVGRSLRSGGVACAVLRDDELYLAQAGTAVACVCRQGTLSCLPDRSPDEKTAERTFGRRRDPDVRLAYHLIQAGDAIMLADSGLVGQASHDALAEALRLADAALSLDSLAQVLPTGVGAILVLAMRGHGVPTPVPSVAPTRRRPTAPGLSPIPGEPVEIAAGPFDPSTKLRAGYPQDKPFDYPQDKPPVPPGPTLGERLASLRKVVGRGLAATGRVAGDWLRRLTPGDEGPYRGARRPTDRKLRRQTTSDHTAWRYIALILPVIVLLVVIGVNWKRGWDREARYNELMAEVEKQLEIAATADEATSRQALETALTALEEAAQIPSHEEAVSLFQVDVQQQLDTLNKVVRLDKVKLLYTYPPVGEADQIVVHGADIYVLDRLTDRLYYHRLNEAGTGLESDEERLLVRKGEQADTIAVVGELIGMTWMPGGEGRQTGALLILERNGSLLAHYPTWGQLVGTILPASERWRYPVDVSGYKGRFYILDPGLGQVLRYHASGAGYDSPPEEYFADDQVDLSGAIDMAIDGFIYLLFEDGRLEKYLSGEPVPLTLSLTDQPLLQPSALYTAPDTDVRFLYVVDPLNGRVLRSDKEGRLIQQFILQDNDALNQAHDIFVDEVGSRLYFLSSNRLFVVNIPPP